MARGKDGGGSIRIPAAYCGLFGLRPSRGRISAGPAEGEIWFGASAEGVLSRSVQDTAAVLDLLAGGEAGDPFVIARPSESYVQLMQRDPPRFRIGFSFVSPVWAAVRHAAVSAAE